MFFSRKKNLSRKDIEPDEILMDSANLPGFERGLFEGRLESPLPSKIPYVILAVFFLGLSGIIFRLFELEITRGEEYLARAESNRLLRVRLPAERGLIYDRNMKELAWNADDGRRYPYERGFGHVLGYLGYADEFIPEVSAEVKIGKAGIENVFDEVLRGRDGSRLIEEDAKGEFFAESVELAPENGRSAVLTIDAGIQSELFKIIENVAADRGFKAGAGAAIDVKSGEIMALVSAPEYDSNVLSKGGVSEKISGYIKDESNPFFFRAIDGLYPPGSTFKTVVALAALAEKIIDPEKQILSMGSISIPNPYFPDKPSVFYDWKAHGWVDMRRAIAVSSNVYFYSIGGGFGEQAGLGVRRIIDYASRLGFGKKTGLELGGAEGFLPTPEWKEKNVPSDPVWRIGDTYNLSIGQGMLQVSPLQMALLASTIANEGLKPSPHLLKSLLSANGTKETAEIKEPERADVPEAVFKIVKEGMREAAETGTASSLAGVGVKAAGKTGTAEIGSGTKVNSWFIGFFPYDDPKVALAIVLEGGRAENLVGAPYAASRIVRWIAQNRPELIR